MRMNQDLSKNGDYWEKSEIVHTALQATGSADGGFKIVCTAKLPYFRTVGDSVVIRSVHGQHFILFDNGATAFGVTTVVDVTGCSRILNCTNVCTGPMKSSKPKEKFKVTS